MKFTPGGASALVAVAMLAVAPGDLRAGGFGIPELGVRRTGMGATIGRPDEPSAVYHNPAGLTLQHGLRIYASAGLAMISTEFWLRPWEGSETYLDAPVDSDGYYPGTKPSRAAAVIPMLVVTAEIKPDRLWGALSLYVANATGAKFDRDAVTQYHLIDGYIVSPLLEATVAYKLSDQLSLGAGLGLMNVRVHGNRYFFPIFDGTDLSNIFGSKPELTLDGSDWVPSWRIGALVTPTPRLTLGAAIIGRVDATLEGPVTLVYGEDSSDPGYHLRGTQETELLLPWTFHAGANYDALPQLEVGADLRYYLYRQYDQQRTKINDIFLIQELVTEKNYHDSIQASGGVRVHDLAFAPGLELMLGTHYDKTPAPAQTVTLDQPTFSHWGLHSGGRYQLGRYRIGASYTRYWYDIPTIEDSITMPPSNVRGDGVNNIFALSIEATLRGGSLL